MALVDNEGKHIIEPGTFEVFIGGSQPDKRSHDFDWYKCDKR